MGHNVFFYDTYAHSHKVSLPRLTEYAVAPHLNSVTSARLALEFVREALFNRRLLAFVKELVAEVLRLGLPKMSLKASLIVALRALHMWHFFRDREIDLFHGQHASWDALATLMLAKHYFKRPCLVTVFGSEFTMAENQKFLTVAEHICTRSDAVMCISGYTRDRMVGAGIVPRSEVIYLGVDPKHFAGETSSRSSDSSLPATDDPPLVLYVGWLIERKGPQVLMEGLSRLTHLPWKAVFVGPDHGLLVPLQRRAAALGLSERVSILEGVSDDELLSIYDQADVFVFPTLSGDEGFGLVGVEAMAHGLPVVASRVGAIPETVVDGETGLFFAAGDDEALAHQLARLLSHPELRSKMGVAAARRVREHFSWDKTAREVVALYQGVVEGYDVRTL
jgi:glycosyltransferase involved in cell wall biosynthesis